MLVDANLHNQLSILTEICTFSVSALYCTTDWYFLFHTVHDERDAWLFECYLISSHSCKLLTQLMNVLQHKNFLIWDHVLEAIFLWNEKKMLSAEKKKKKKVLIRHNCQMELPHSPAPLVNENGHKRKSAYYLVILDLKIWCRWCWLGSDCRGRSRRGLISLQSGDIGHQN